MQRKLAYPVTLDAESGGYVVTFEDFPAAISEGDSLSEALDEAADALGLVIGEALAAGEDLPPPSPARGRPLVSPPALIAAKAALIQTVREKNIKGRQLARELGLGESEIRRMLDPFHATKIERIETALAHLGKRLEIIVHDAA